MIPNDKDIERSLLRAIADRIGTDRFELWFGSGTRVVLDAATSQPRIVVPDKFLADWIRVNFRQVVDAAARCVFGVPCSVPVVVGDPASLSREADRHSKISPEISPTISPGIPLHGPDDALFLKKAEMHATIGLPHSHAPSKTALPGTIRSAVIQADPIEAASIHVSPIHGAPIQSPAPWAGDLRGDLRKIVVPSLGGRPREKTTAVPVSTVATVSKSEGTPGSRRFETLETFVAGPSNHLARQAADFAIRYPGKINPIYIHGSTSLGKTHLLEAIWSAVRKHSGTGKIGSATGSARKLPLFMSAEQFTNAFIASIRQGGMPAFRNKFRDISVLLIDDLPFLAGKKQTQTELVHLIDTLKSRGVQLVFTGDRPLGRLTELRGEILSRLEAGMVCGIKTPESETLLAIFRQMIAARGIAVPDDVCRFVVGRLNAHARQLSGALNRLHAVHLTTGEPITLATAENALDDLLRSNHRPVKIQDIEKTVRETFGLGTQALQSKSRSKSVSHPRMLAMWLARKYTRSALTEIGKFFGDRSHSTVITAQKNVEKWLNDDTEILCGDSDCRAAEAIRRLEQALVGSVGSRCG